MNSKPQMLDREYANTSAYIIFTKLSALGQEKSDFKLNNDAHIKQIDKSSVCLN